MPAGVLLLVPVLNAPEWFHDVMRRTVVADDSCVYRNATLLCVHKTFVLLPIICKFMRTVICDLWLCIQPIDNT